MKVWRLLTVAALILAFGTVTSFAAEYWVVKDQNGKLMVVEKKPSESAMIYKGPFTHRAEADQIITTGPAVVGPPAAVGVAPVPPHGAAVPPPPPGGVGVKAPGAAVNVGPGGVGVGVGPGAGK